MDPTTTGNTAWLLTAIIAVILMLPGLVLFYGGMVSRRTTTNMMMMVFGSFALTAFVWVAFGYSAVFGGRFARAQQRRYRRRGLDRTARRMVEVVAASQAAGVEAVRAGAQARSVDEVCRALITEAEEGWGEAFLHSTGHGVGLEIHEDPRVSATSTDTLVAGHVVTLAEAEDLPGHGQAVRVRFESS